MLYYKVHSKGKFQPKNDVEAMGKKKIYWTEGCLPV